MGKGVFFTWSAGQSIPCDADTVTTAEPTYTHAGKRNLLNWYIQHEPWIGGAINAFTSEAELRSIEQAYINAYNTYGSNFEGVSFLGEEHHCEHIMFPDTLDMQWFGENLQGYAVWLQSHPNQSQRLWRQDMLFRMIRGFYNYFHARNKLVGFHFMYTFLKDWQFQFNQGWELYLGEQARAFLNENYDYMYFYIYTWSLTSWTTRGYRFPNTTALPKDYFLLIDQLFPNPNLEKRWILTRKWSANDQWEVEAIALEVKHALDRGMDITVYRNHDPALNTPTFNEFWSYLTTAINLYNTKSYMYIEQRANGVNLLTGETGFSYGWIDYGQKPPDPPEPNNDVALLAFLTMLFLMYFIVGGKK
jgi:hypothetical protein